MAIHSPYAVDPQEADPVAAGPAGGDLIPADLLDGVPPLDWRPLPAPFADPAPAAPEPDPFSPQDTLMLCIAFACAIATGVAAVLGLTLMSTSLTDFPEPPLVVRTGSDAPEPRALDSDAVVAAAQALIAAGQGLLNFFGHAQAHDESLREVLNDALEGARFCLSSLDARYAADADLLDQIAAWLEVEERESRAAAEAFTAELGDAL